MPADRKKAYLALLVTAFIWGLAPPIIKYSLGFVSTLGFLFYRFLIAGLVFLLPLLWRLWQQRPTRQQSILYLVLGFLGTPLTLWLLFTGLERTTAIAGSVIWVIAPILVVLGGKLFLKETITRTEQIGITLTLIGTVITIVQPLLETGLAITSNLLGNTLVLAGTCVWALFTLLTKKYQKLDSFVLSASSFWVGLVVLAPFFTTTRTVGLSSQALFGIVYMALFGSVIAYSTYIYGVSKIEASEATIFTYLQPIFSVPLAAVWLKESITLPFLLGAALILAGVFICEKR